MKILFCADPLHPTQPDAMYAAEVAAAEAAGLSYHLINFERLVQEKRPLAAVADVPSDGAPDSAIFRGWIMRPENYEALYEALQHKGLTLINSPAAYKHCHYLPENYPLIEPYTAKSVWLPYDATTSFSTIMAQIAPFGNVPLVLKDYVKSRKDEWREACYIPSATSRAEVERVVLNFLGLQGAELNEGLVFREFLPFRRAAGSRDEHMPPIAEYRCFIKEGTILATVPQWDATEYEAIHPLSEPLAALIPQIQSQFFTMDIAQHENGQWFIVELGDGQVAGLPNTLDPADFYRALQKPTPL